MATEIISVCSINQKNFPALSFETTTASFGSVGSATIVTSVVALQKLKIDLFKETSGSKPAVIQIQVAGVSPNGEEQTFAALLFAGEALTTEIDYDAGTVAIKARSWAGRLLEQKRVPTALGAAITKLLAPLAIGQSESARGFATENQQVASIVTSIAELYGLTPVINLSGASLSGFHGTSYGSAATSFFPTPQNLWLVLCDLARDVGCVVYDTPDKQLVFGVPGAGLPTVTFSWNLPPPKNAHACRRLQVTHDPRRSSTFRVLVTSYDPASKQPTLGRATVVGSGQAGLKGYAQGVYAGTAAVGADAALAGGGGKAAGGQVQLYTFQIDGLTQAQAQAKAQAMATDISQRELTARWEAEPMPSLRPSTPINLVLPSAALQLGSSNRFYVSGITHKFVMPSSRGGRHGGQDGLVCQVKALSLPVETIASGGIS